MRRFSGIIVSVVALFVVISCHDEQHAPTQPVVSDALRAFTREGEALSGQFRAYKDVGQFQLDIPIAGDYELLYTLSSGTGELIFRLGDSSFLIGQCEEGQEILDLSLQKGVVRDAPDSSSSDLETFVDLPFDPDPTFGTLVLLKDGNTIVPTPTPRPTPTVLPTPTPQPLPENQGTLTVIAAVGDSITYGVGSDVGGYPRLLEWKLQSAGYRAVVRNSGIPSEQAFATAARFQSVIQGADAVLLMIGTNDVWNTFNCPAPGFCQASNSIRTMLVTAQQAGVTPIVSLVPPIRSRCAQAALNDEIQMLNNQIRSVAGELHVALVDNFSPMLTSGADAFFVDCLHFNDSGYDVMANQWLSALLGQNIMK